MNALQKNKLLTIYLLTVLLLIAAIISGLLSGSANINPKELFAVAFGGDAGSAAARILLYVRIPRVLASIFCGAALAIAGAVIQGVLANRLASPSIIGVNSGAGLAVTVSSALGVVGGFGMSIAAFAGAFVSVMLIAVSARRWGASRGTVILMGVALNAFTGAVTDSITTLFPDLAIMSNDFKIGDFSSVTYESAVPSALIVFACVLILLSLSNELDVLILGDENAKSLGLNAGSIRVVFLLLAALLSGAAVSVCGLLSFVGLLVPHALRSLGVKGSFHLMLLSTLAGGGFVSLSDTIARVMFAPYELPVGIIMAFIGAPFFLIILIRGKGGHSRA